MTSIDAGECGETANSRNLEIRKLASEFETFYSSTTLKLDAFYANFDEGSKDYKAYHERYTKFKMECELHRGALKRREQEQQKCSNFVAQCERNSNELMAILARIQADDWANENKDVKKAERDFDVRTLILNTGHGC